MSDEALEQLEVEVNLKPEAARLKRGQKLPDGTSKCRAKPKARRPAVASQKTLNQQDDVCKGRVTRAQKQKASMYGKTTSVALLADL